VSTSAGQVHSCCGCAGGSLRTVVSAFEVLLLHIFSLVDLTVTSGHGWDRKLWVVSLLCLQLSKWPRVTPRTPPSPRDNPYPKFCVYYFLDFHLSFTNIFETLTLTYICCLFSVTRTFCPMSYIGISQPPGRTICISHNALIHRTPLCEEVITILLAPHSNQLS
jgi:hypothetical protein